MRIADAYAIARIGERGLARVFVPTEFALGRRVAVKILPPEIAIAFGVARFRRAVRVVAGLQHSHAVRLLSTGEAAGPLYFTMPFVEGETLWARLTSEDALPLADAVRFLREIANVPAYVAGVVPLSQVCGELAHDESTRVPPAD